MAIINTDNFLSRRTYNVVVMNTAFANQRLKGLLRATSLTVPVERNVAVSLQQPVLK